ncbi:hypothetical protein ACFV98_11930 [Streptomyces violascens]|uniref:hypothetical protein n=1 Tax=Streptomyces violascens TaxID=67381 RepID=UPI00364CCD97
MARQKEAALLQTEKELEMPEFADLPASEKNFALAEWALDALDAYALNMGSTSDWAEDYSAGQVDEGNLMATGADLIDALMRLARLNGIEPQAMIDKGVAYHLSSVTDENEAEAAAEDDATVALLCNRGITDIENFLKG